MQPRLSAKWKELARHLLIRSRIPGVPSGALPLHPPVQPPELTCLMFRLPSPIRQGASRLEAHAAVFQGETPKPTEARKTKATQRDPPAAESTFSSSFSLICCYTHSAQDNVKFLKLCFLAYEKSGAGKRGPPGSYFKSGLRDVVGGWLGPRRSLANQEEGVGPGSRRGCLRKDSRAFRIARAGSSW